jgi:hypothetical protein
VLCIVGFWPVKENISHPKSVTLQMEANLQIPVELSVFWYDLSLNKKYYTETVKFDASGRATVPETAVQTRLWRLGLKHILTRLNRWSYCPNCDGPRAICSLQLKEGYRPPSQLRLVQSRTEMGDNLILRISLIPDESQFTSRDFRPQNADALLAEAKELIAKGTTNNISPTIFGAELKAINPVRVECRYDVLILWMGGKTGYVVAPDSETCPAINMVWTSGTDNPHIFKLEKI